MNRDINFTLSALVPLLRMNGEKVVSIEAVEDWYTIDGREYMKEVAEIEYESGYCQYADIGCDSNLTAICDVIAVINQVKPKSSRIERIVRDVYPKPEQDRWIPVTERMPEINCKVLLKRSSGKVFIGTRDPSPDKLYLITEEDGSQDWVYDPDSYVEDSEIESLPTALDCYFKEDTLCGRGENVACVLDPNYKPNRDGVIEWKPLPESFRPDAK